jgi:hypothetical protein
MVKQALRWVSQSVAGQPRVRQDAQLLKKILKLDPSELCKRQCQ